MAKVDATVIKETKYIAKFVILLSVAMQAVFLISGRWNYTVLLGNVLSAFAGTLNFFLMGISVQKALTKDAQSAKTTMKISQTYRTFFLAVILIIGFTVPVFDKWATVIGILFPRVAVACSGFVRR